MWFEEVHLFLVKVRGSYFVTFGPEERNTRQTPELVLLSDLTAKYNEGCRISMFLSFLFKGLIFYNTFATLNSF